MKNLIQPVNKLVPVNQISPNTFYPVTPEKVAAAASNIKLGIFPPLSLRQVSDDQYRNLGDEAYLRAAIEIGYQELWSSIVPCEDDLEEQAKIIFLAHTQEEKPWAVRGKEYPVLDLFSQRYWPEIKQQHPHFEAKIKWIAMKLSMCKDYVYKLIDILERDPLLLGQVDAKEFSFYEAWLKATGQNQRKQKVSKDSKATDQPPPECIYAAECAHYADLMSQRFQKREERNNSAAEEANNE